ncbi:Mu transposase domain-containing protein [Nonomuraea sp. H19]|uniref:Mu transposase domain-containing protein n=1 Tax=Nonomuraea sp. H19 TaxID=3452206 RepID=UPI003F8B9311
MVAFEANLYSVPAHRVQPRQLVEVRATKVQIMLHATTPDHTGQTLLAAHQRAVRQGQGKGHNSPEPAPGPLAGLLNRSPPGRGRTLDPRWSRSPPGTNPSSYLPPRPILNANLRDNR